MPSNNNGGPVFNVSYSALAITTNPQDMLGFLSSRSRMQLIYLSLTQNSSAVANDQTLGVQFYRGSTASSTGAALTPVNVLGWTSPAASVAVTLDVLSPAQLHARWRSLGVTAADLTKARREAARAIHPDHRRKQSK
jgi:hypothetical protein